MNNGFILTINQQGHLNNYGNIWYHPKAIRYILSMSNIKKKNHIIYDSKNEDRFIVINTRHVGHIKRKDSTHLTKSEGEWLNWHTTEIKGYTTKNWALCQYNVYPRTYVSHYHIQEN